MGRSKPTAHQTAFVERLLAALAVGLALPHCFHRFAPPKSDPSAQEEGGAGGDGGEGANGASGGAAGFSGSSGRGAGGNGSGGRGVSGAPGAGTTGDAGDAGAMSSSGGASGSGGADVSVGGSTGGLAAGGSGASVGAGGAGSAGEGTAGDGGQPATKPQCAVDGSTPRLVLEDDFESYALGAPYEQNGSPWVRAVEGRVGQVSAERAASGVQSLELWSFLYDPEVAYVSLALNGPPRRVILELRYAPEGSTVYKDFAEFGLAQVPSKFDLRPTVAFEVNDHVLELRAAPEKPIASSNGKGPYEAAIKPPFVELFNEVPYENDGSTVSYFRLDLDFCEDTVSAYVGADEQAPLVRTQSFNGSAVPQAVYLAGGLSTTFVDDVRVLVDD